MGGCVADAAELVGWVCDFVREIGQHSPGCLEPIKAFEAAVACI